MICVFEDGHFSNVCLEIDAGILQHWGLFWNRRCADGGLLVCFLCFLAHGMCYTNVEYRTGSVVIRWYPSGRRAMTEFTPSCNDFMMTFNSFHQWLVIVWLYLKRLEGTIPTSIWLHVTCALCLWGRAPTCSYKDAATNYTLPLRTVHPVTRYFADEVVLL